jgi:hypothetical protein
MRYVKTYESFGNPVGRKGSDDREYFKSELEDILRELEDDNIRVDVNFWDGVEVFLTNRNEHSLGNFTAPDTFPYEIIKPNIEHLVSFLKYHGYRIKSIHNIVDLNPKESLRHYWQLDGDEIGRLELRFIR